MKQSQYEEPTGIPGAGQAVYSRGQSDLVNLYHSCARSDTDGVRRRFRYSDGGRSHTITGSCAEPVSHSGAFGFSNPDMDAFQCLAGAPGARASTAFRLIFSANS